MKSYWRLTDSENGETISVFEKEMKSNRDLDYINHLKSKWTCKQITEAEFQYEYPRHGVEAVPAIPKESKPL